MAVVAPTLVNNSLYRMDTRDSKWTIPAGS